MFPLIIVLYISKQANKLLFTLKAWIPYGMHNIFECWHRSQAVGNLVYTGGFQTLI